MLKQKKEFKINFLALEIVAIICLIICGIGVLLSIFKFHQLNIVHFWGLLGISTPGFVLSLIHLIIHNIVYFQRRKEMTYVQYNSITIAKENDIYSIVVLNSTLAVIAIILIILALIL